ncbi:hypothetical protein LSAT2_032727 [Lamellibrachia satsuma]|nr:hypothetical protein LSAT2_032727 [Lamellibrachia satsuma]
MGCCVSGFSSTCFTHCSASVCCCEDNRVHPLVGSSKGRGSLSSPVHDDIALPGQSAGGHEIAKPLKMPLTEREVIVMMRSWKNVQNKIVETGMATFLR